MAGGKTIIMGGLLNYFTANYNFTNNLVAAPFANLRAQIELKLRDMGALATVTTFHSSIATALSLGPLDTLIFDEAHHIMGTEWRNIVDLAQYKLICGFTATPFRADDCPLLETNGGIFDTLIDGPDIEELTNQGYLANLDYYTYPIRRVVEVTPLSFTGEDWGNLEKIYYAPENKEGEIVEEYVKNFNEMMAIAFCKTVRHAQEITNKFLAKGISSATVNCYQSKKLVKATLSDFANGQVKILTACNMASEGLDIPKVKLGLLARPIVNSVTLFLQQVGRFLRPYNGESAKVLDLVGNIYTFGRPEEAYKRVIV